MKGFGSDNHAGIHPEILKEFLACNFEHEPSYGTDAYSLKAIEEFHRQFNSKPDVHFVYNGTAANILCLRAGLQRHEAVLCSDVSHLFIDECGAPEFFAGKVIPLKSKNGKMLISEIEKHIIRKGDQHYSQPRMISLTQPTELGTCYSLSELKEIIQIAQKHKIYVHIDGARFTNACAFLDLPYSALTTDLQIDCMSFGGTKNGLAFGEAVLIWNDDLKKDFKFIRKQSAQLPSKTRFISSQFLGYFKNETNLKIAKHAHQMALELEKSLQQFSEIKISQAVQSNSVFAIIPKKWISELRDCAFFYVWDQTTFECRLMTAWDTDLQEIQNFTEKLKLLARDLPL